ncbi:hypothetical protein PPYR_10323 [Photinus pyralis]|uniref:Protein disulfide-isomerase n=1 Tax=Photinus pyralis TaxID=7054 RepID=A0A1Y1JU28_PHOPY|nr:protein disulfide-isomerase-like [Photinus pyralis]KAB0796262.1 hypothetical protein PPYR_10323 [Photinus pyralis]
MFVLFLVLTLTASCRGEVELEDGVAVLTDDTFDEYIGSRDYVLVEFYAPWCGHCKSLAPEYAKAAQILSEAESPITLAKVDATQQNALAEKYKVSGYPTLKFFKNGSPIPYTGGRVAEGIVIWLNKRIGPSAQDLKSPEDTKALIDQNEVVTVGFFKDQSSANAAVFLEMADSNDEMVFGITSDEHVFKQYSAKNGDIFLFKKYDDKLVQFKGELNAENLKRFLEDASRPLVSEVTIASARKLFSSEIKHFLLLILSKSNEKSSKYVEALRSIAKSFKQKMIFVTIDSDVEENEAFMQFLKATADDVPVMRIIHDFSNLKRYVPKSKEVTAKSIDKFVQDYFDGKLERHLLSEDLPEDWNKGPVYTLVASNFDSVAFDTTKDVLVEFYAPWCGFCKKIAPIYEEVGEYFKDKDDVIIAKMDATLNELEHTNVRGFPTIKFYPKGSTEGITFEGDRSFKGIVKFVESGGTDQSEEEETEDTPQKDEL